MSNHRFIGKVVQSLPAQDSISLLETIISSKLQMSTKVKRVERHPAFQYLDRARQNLIHAGSDHEKKKAMAFFAHLVVNALESQHDLPDSSMEFRGLERLNVAVHRLRNRNTPSKMVLSQAEKDKRRATAAERRSQRSQDGPTGQTGGAKDEGKRGLKGGNTRNARKRHKRVVV